MLVLFVTVKRKKCKHVVSIWKPCIYKSHFFIMENSPKFIISMSRNAPFDFCCTPSSGLSLWSVFLIILIIVVFLLLLIIFFTRWVWFPGLPSFLCQLLFGCWFGLRSVKHTVKHKNWRKKKQKTQKVLKAFDRFLDASKILTLKITSLNRKVKNQTFKTQFSKLWSPVTIL